MIIDSRPVVVSGRFIRTLRLRDEWDEDVENPEDFLGKIRASGARADLFTFMQRLPESRPRFGYRMLWDSVAAIPIVDYDFWLKKQVCKNSRKKIGLAQRKGVEIRPCPFDDDLLRGILEIYHETPLLQGKPNRQYRTDFETARKLNGTFLDRAQFIGAFVGDELIAYIKLVSTDRYMRTMGILAKTAHRDKGAMNFLIAKAVEICAERRIPYLMYAKFNYGRRGSATLREFKKNMGFESIILPRYYIPLTGRGKLALSLGLHKDLGDLLPERLVRTALTLRNTWYEKKYRAQTNGN